MHAVSCLLLLCLTYLAHARPNEGCVAEGCLVDIWGVKSRHEPVLVVGFTLALPDRWSGQLKLPRGGMLVAGCPGYRNSLKLDRGIQHATAACTPAGKLEVSGMRVLTGDLWCERRSVPEARRTGRRCGPANMLDVYELGFSVSRRWLPAIEVCHNTDTANTLYSYHQLYGSLQQRRRTQTSRPSFSPGHETGTLYVGISVNDVYKGPAVQETLAAALGSQEKAAELLAQSAINRGHLAPSGDFILNTHQHASFFYANAAPQWQAFNAGNWLSVESVLRNHAAMQFLDLKVWTGTHGVLSLYGAEELYLTWDRRIAVPKFFWKLVLDPRSGKAIAFVGLNNPFATCNVTHLCPDVCSEAGWARRTWNQPSKGLVICCSAQQLAKAVPGVPRVNATGLLPGPKA